MKPFSLVTSAILFVIGACGAFVFLTVNDPDSVSSDVISRFGWLVFGPLALLFSIRLRSLCWLGAVSMLAGVFLGVCVRCMIPPHQSNIWPIAALVWTALFVLPVAAGAVTGGLGGWLIRRFHRGRQRTHPNGIVMKTYRAPWSTSLIAISTLATVLCIGIAVSLIGSRAGIFPWIALLPLALVCGGALFIIRGYTITPGAILVHRLFWTTRLPLTGLQSARFVPDAMRWSLRTFGNGGLFSFTGFFRNKVLGAYRAYVTDPHRTVVLHFPTRTVVVSPSAPEAFVHDVGIISHTVQPCAMTNNRSFCLG